MHSRGYSSQGFGPNEDPYAMEKRFSVKVKVK
jgi:hypothetical protein